MSADTITVRMVGGPAAGKVRTVRRGVKTIVVPEYRGLASFAFDNGGPSLSIRRHTYLIEPDTKRAIYQVEAPKA